MSTNIYILECQGGRYYIGKSDNVQARFEQHKQGYGSSWTTKYKPIKIVKIIPNSNHFEEDKQVKELMQKYGIEKVRGGSYVQEKLDNNTIQFLRKELYGATNCCSRCGRNNHFVKDCYASVDIDGNKLDEDEDEYICYKCGREGHYAYDCYAKKHINRYYLN